jgi:Na+/H+ antiporter NhaD/arsenite permease-like protein
MAGTDTDTSLDTTRIQDWRSIVTLVVFVVTNIIVLFPFHIPIYFPRSLSNAVLDALSALRVISPRPHHHAQDGPGDDDANNGKDKPFVRWNFPLDFTTAPLVADLFLLAILAIGKDEVQAGTIGADNIEPIDVLAMFITLAYIAISIDASGLIRYLAFKVLQKGGSSGNRLFFYLYTFFFVLGSFIGNDPIILSGTAFLAYMTRVSSNIVHPRAWIHAQFAVANIASAILVSSNPTNLVLAGAFKIKFVDYTANMIVPVIFTGIVLLPFLMYIVFKDETLIPSSIKMHELSAEVMAKKPVNPNIPHARGTAEEEENNHVNDEQGKLLSLEEIMNPFLDKGGAAFGGIVMAATLITVLALNASGSEQPVFYVTLPGAFVMFCWDLAFGWWNRHETREIARRGRQEVEEARAERAIRERAVAREAAQAEEAQSAIPVDEDRGLSKVHSPEEMHSGESDDLDMSAANTNDRMTIADEKQDLTITTANNRSQGMLLDTASSWGAGEKNATSSDNEVSLEKQISRELERGRERERATLVSLASDAYKWSQETFPTVTAVVSHLPFALIPFAFCMFVLVQALASKGWVAVFAYGWDHWVEKTGTVGAVGGMGFLSVILCNVSLSCILSLWAPVTS